MARKCTHMYTTSKVLYTYLVVPQPLVTHHRGDPRPQGFQRHVPKRLHVAGEQQEVRRGVGLRQVQTVEPPCHVDPRAGVEHRLARPHPHHQAFHRKPSASKAKYSSRQMSGRFSGTKRPAQIKHT